MSDRISLLGREAESARIESFCDEILHGSRVVLIEGEIGIGKTILLRHAAERVAARGYLVLRANPVEAEVPLEFAALADLFEAVPNALIEALPDPQRRAVGVAVLRRERPEEQVDPRTIATAVRTVLGRLSEAGPAVLVVDDLPLLDPPSARVLSFVLRRVGSARVGLLTAVRTDWSEASPATVVDDLDVARLERLRLGPISLGALRELVLARVGSAPSRSELIRLREVTGGNPMFALELAASPSSGRITQLDTALSLPASLRGIVLSRLSDLTDGERDVLLGCALMSDPSPSAACASATDPTSAVDDLDSLIRAGVLADRGGRLVFAHPLIRSVIVGDAPSGVRRAAHLRLADSVEPPEVRARHLALGTVGPDEAIARSAEDAARIAGARGAGETAAELAGLAAKLTPAANATDRHRRIALEAEWCFETSDLDRACSLLEPVVAEMPPGPNRAGVLRMLARYLGYRGTSFAAWSDMLTDALDEAGEDASLRAHILFDLGVLASNSGDQTAGLAYARSALEFAERANDLSLQGQLCAGFAWAQFVAGGGVDHELVARAVAGSTAPTRESMELRPNVVVGHLLHLSDDLDGARERYEQEYQRAKQEGIETGLPLLLWGFVQAEAYAGHWDHAEQLAREGCVLAEDSGSSIVMALILAARSLVHTYRGRLDAGRADTEKALDLSHELGVESPVPFAIQSFGVSRLSVGDAAGAHLLLGPFAEEVRSSGVGEPGLLRFLPDEIEALVRLGELDAASELLEPFEVRSQELGRGSGVAASWRCHSLLLAARGDRSAAEAALATALDVHEHLPLPFEHARTLLVGGEVHRRARHKSLAEARLNEARAIFERLGAPRWVERTRAELDRLGIRQVSSSAELTESERRVADLVAEGLSTPQVAARLFMAQRTVESHLSHIYRKLGVTSRTEMAHAYLSSSGAAEA